MQECVICCENLPLENYLEDTHLSHHEICNDCVAKYLAVKIMNEAIISVTCPAEGCNAILDYMEIKAFSTVKTFARCPQTKMYLT